MTITLSVFDHLQTDTGLSEDLRNYTIIIGLIAGGIWAWYQLRNQNKERLLQEQSVLHFGRKIEKTKLNDDDRLFLNIRVTIKWLAQDNGTNQNVRIFVYATSST